MSILIVALLSIALAAAHTCMKLLEAKVYPSLAHGHGAKSYLISAPDLCCIHWKHGFYRLLTCLISQHPDEETFLDASTVILDRRSV